jgi:hypothetical protein
LLWVIEKNKIMLRDIMPVLPTGIKQIRRASKGFVNPGALGQDVGRGFVMDDFVMEKAV